MMGKKIYVGNLSFEVDSEQLEKLFSEHGTVRDAQVIQDRMTGRSRGFGFVEMSSDAEAQTAIAALHEHELGGRHIIVNEAKAQEQRRGKPGGRRGRW